MGDQPSRARPASWVPAPREAGATVTTRAATAVAGTPRGAPIRPAAPHTGLAWLVREVTHVPGVLHFDGARLRFVSTQGVLFDATPADLDLAPSRTTRGAFRVTLGRERLRLHVVRFPGAVDVAAELRGRETGDLPDTAGEASAGVLWRRVLGPAAADRLTTGARAWAPARARRACAALVRWC